MELGIAEENHCDICFIFLSNSFLKFVALLKYETLFNEYHESFDLSLNSSTSGKDR